jgi:preprotein translocase subunit Sec63
MNFHRRKTMKLINTIKGEMDESLLEKRTGEIDDDNEFTQWIEYWLEDELVHRSVHVQLKKNVVTDSIAALF